MKHQLNHPAVHGVAVFLLGLLLSGLWLANIETNQESEQTTQEQSNPRNSYAPTDKPLTGIPPLPAVDLQPNTTAKREQSRQAQAEPPNRYFEWLIGAVLKSAITDWLMFLSTVGLAFIAVWQIVTNRRQTRAYLGVANLEFRKDASGVVDFRQVNLTIQNGGQTPAFKVRVMGNWTPRAFGEELPRDFGYPDTGAKPQDEELLSASRIMLMPTEMKPYAFYPPVAKLQDARQGKCFLYFYGHANYVDIFKKNRSTTFCYVYLLDRPSSQAGFVAYRDHNESDPK